MIENIEQARGTTLIKGWGKLHLTIFSGKREEICFELNDVAYVPTLSEHLLSLQSATRYNYRPDLTETGTYFRDEKNVPFQAQNLRCREGIPITPQSVG